MTNLLIVKWKRLSFRDAENWDVLIEQDMSQYVLSSVACVHKQLRMFIRKHRILALGEDAAFKRRAAGHSWEGASLNDKI